MATAIVSRSEWLDRARAREILEERDSIRCCKEWVIAHDAGPMYWLRNLTKTENYQWKEQGLQPTAPFPYKPYPLEMYRERCKMSHAHSLEGCCQASLDSLPFAHRLSPANLPDYLDLLVGYLMVEKEIYVPKTREMITSWSVMGFITWFCQFYEKIGWIGQSEKDDKAQGLVKYSGILYANQPDWMKQAFPLKRGDSATLHRVDWANGSWFKAVPQGERQLASEHPHGYFSDESAHQDAWKATVNIARPAVRQLIHVSSAAPSDFMDECETGIS